MSSDPQAKRRPPLAKRALGSLVTSATDGARRFIRAEVTAAP